MSIQRGITIGKDLLCFFGGLSGVAYQQITENVNIALLGIFVGMIGLPGLTSAISLFRQSGTDPQSSTSAPPHSPTESNNI